MFSNSHITNGFPLQSYQINQACMRRMANNIIFIVFKTRKNPDL